MRGKVSHNVQEVDSNSMKDMARVSETPEGAAMAQGEAQNQTAINVRRFRSQKRGARRAKQVAAVLGGASQVVKTSRARPALLLLAATGLLVRLASVPNQLHCQQLGGPEAHHSGNRTAVGAVPHAAPPLFVRAHEPHIQQVYLERRDEAPLRPGKLLAEYVSNQGQRILKNLVNSTIDLVAQSSVRAANANLNGSRQPPASGMGRLYTMFFPTQAPSTSTSTSASASTASLADASESSAAAPGSAPESGSALEQLAGEAGRAPGAAGFQFGDAAAAAQLSLGAPYDAWPLGAGLVARLRARGRRPGVGVVASEWRHSPHANSLEQQEQESLGALYAASLEPEEAAQLTADGGQLSLADEQKLAAAQSGADQQVLEPGEREPEPEAEQEYLGAANRSSAPGETAHSVELASLEEEKEQEESLAARWPASLRQEDADEDQVSRLSPTAMGAEQLFGSSAANGSQFEAVAADSSPSLREALAREPGRVSGSATNYSGNGTAEFAAASSDDSFFTIHLPASYENDAVQAPPPGHYDDYFKLLSASEQPPEVLYQAAPAPNRSSRHLGLDGADELRAPQLAAGRAGRQPRDEPPALELAGRGFRNGSAPPGAAIHYTVYEMPALSERRLQANESSAPAMELAASLYPQPAGESGSSARAGLYPRYEPAGAGQTPDDGVQVIIARTNNSRDPLSKDKLIDYSSEHRNFTWVSNSPRESFINKDMNEIPADLPLTSGAGPQPPAGAGLSRPASAGLLPVQQYIVGNLAGGTQTDAVRQQPEVLAGEARRAFQQQQQSPFHLSQMMELGEARSTEAEQQPAPQRAQDEPERAPDARGAGRAHVRPAHKGRARLAAGDEPAGKSRKRDRAQSRRDKRLRVSGAKQRAKSRQQAPAGEPRQAARRLVEQVTQVSFDPKELALREPGAGRQAAAGIGELPAKVRRLREHQPDKNELMNELLAALDRVKLAIYRLQPLTARMNAIYRKSVTSNTRDLVMDSNKGAYAKRYPPGDYDDSYDRLRPTDVEVQQQQQQQQQRSPNQDDEPPAEHRQQVELEAGQRASAQTRESSAVAAPPEPAGSLDEEPVPRVGAELEASDSQARQVYLTPAELAGAGAAGSRRGWRRFRSLELDSLSADQSRLVASGLGRRLGDMSGRSAAALEERANASAGLLEELRAHGRPAGDELPLAPVFGYRITIFQEPAEPADEEERAGPRFAYRLDQISGDEQETLATSESSLVAEARAAQPAAQQASGSSEAASRVDSPQNLAGQSLQQQQQQQQRRSKDEEKRDENWNRSSKRDRKNEEQGNRHKEFKKIKHNKGLTFEERKSMKRDKQIKSHERGAAKEKALKERTQIEFFEREQIVDDEFEKAKRSSAKAQWRTGKEARKSIKASGSAPRASIAGDLTAAADTISSGNSLLAGAKQSADSAKGVAEQLVGSVAGSERAANKTERRLQEARGKKFKGWREKGYKIITETEFIDRGSLHDSAYKKRDKGAAQQHKYKRQESNSEGQQGVAVELHRKLDKKLDKSEKGVSTRETKSQKEEAKRERKRKAAGSAGSAKKARASDSVASSASEPAAFGRHHRAPADQANTLASSATTEAPAAPPPGTSGRALALVRLGAGPRARSLQDAASSLSPATSATTRAPEQPPEASANGSSSSFESTDRGVSGAKLAPQQEASPPPPPPPPPPSVDSKTNASLLDIVDNFTGRRLNKTRIGTYDLSQDDQPAKSTSRSADDSKQAVALNRYLPLLSKLASLPALYPAQPSAQSPSSLASTAKPGALQGPVPEAPAAWRDARSAQPDAAAPAAALPGSGRNFESRYNQQGGYLFPDELAKSRAGYLSFQRPSAARKENYNPSPVHQLSTSLPASDGTVLAQAANVQAESMFAASRDAAMRRASAVVRPEEQQVQSLKLRLAEQAARQQAAANSQALVQSQLDRRAAPMPSPFGPLHLAALLARGVASPDRANPFPPFFMDSAAGGMATDPFAAAARASAALANQFVDQFQPLPHF